MPSKPIVVEPLNIAPPMSQISDKLHSKDYSILFSASTIKLETLHDDQEAEESSNDLV